MTMKKMMTIEDYKEELTKWKRWHTCLKKKHEKVCADYSDLRKDHKFLQHENLLIKAALHNYQNYGLENDKANDIDCRLL